MYSNLAKLRKEQGITQQQMGQLIGCATSNYNRKERGKMNFRITEMEIIKKHFNKPLDEIFLKYDCN